MYAYILVYIYIYTIYIYILYCVCVHAVQDPHGALLQNTVTAQEVILQLEKLDLVGCGRSSAICMAS